VSEKKLEMSMYVSEDGCEMSAVKRQKTSSSPITAEEPKGRGSNAVKEDSYVLIYTDPSLEEGIFTWPLTQTSAVVGFGPGNPLCAKCAFLAVPYLWVADTIDYRYAYGRFLMSPRGVAISNQNYLSISRIMGNAGVRRRELYPSESA
jgi:hypothetical protein